MAAYCDSDWAGCKETRRSTTGFCTLLGQNLISWSAKRQPTVSRSSTEAEYRALSTTAQEITWLSYLLRDIGIPQEQATTLFCDNLSAVYLSANPALHNRSKHFDTDYHYIREQVALGLIETRHIPAALQVADVFTKSLPRRQFTELRVKLGVGNPPTSSLRGNVSVCEDQAQDGAQTEVKLTKPKVETQRSSPSTKAVKSTEKQWQLDNRFDPLRSLAEGQ